MEDLRYPIGNFSRQDTYTAEEINSFIERIKHIPSHYRTELSGLSNEQLDTPYRDGGWTLRQVIHHVADSHMNSFIRFKWALTEDNPLIKAYDEKLWASTPETIAAPELSIALLEALHQKWAVLLQSLSSSDFSKQFVHPASGKATRLDTTLALYAWHGDHHLAHITSLKKRMAW